MKKTALSITVYMLLVLSFAPMASADTQTIQTIRSFISGNKPNQTMKQVEDGDGNVRTSNATTSVNIEDFDLLIPLKSNFGMPKDDEVLLLMAITMPKDPVSNLIWDWRGNNADSGSFSLRWGPGQKFSHKNGVTTYYAYKAKPGNFTLHRFTYHWNARDRHLIDQEDSPKELKLKAGKSYFVGNYVLKATNAPQYDAYIYLKDITSSKDDIENLDQALDSFKISEPISYKVNLPW